nr:MAG TPA: hypothetical protein [Caudoviricetes sp.]
MSSTINFVFLSPKKYIYIPLYNIRCIKHEYFTQIEN